VSTKSGCCWERWEGRKSGKVSFEGVEEKATALQEKRQGTAISLRNSYFEAAGGTIGSPGKKEERAVQRIVQGGGEGGKEMKRRRREDRPRRG